ncbi:YesN/AraC family two-component response regulator [Neobacillus niacini]|uniref:response regulator transcription factor n=1 Tax=Neobacillus niacini TaxID=86668 RepID=UPI002862699C|nr:response regulator [Neobacillus niacini]MDR7078694.1 YesN/AraC family two-component response regulator [Neobacillus niacini]
MWKAVIIDDDKQVLRVMKKAIPWEKIGVTCIGEGTDGEEGLQLITETKPDIVLTDIYMPIMNGMEMLQHARDNGYNGKAIILSGYSDFEYARTALRLQVDDYLSKPATVETIESVLTAVISKLEKEKVFQNDQEDLAQKLEYYQSLYSNSEVESIVMGMEDQSSISDDQQMDNKVNIRHKQAVEYMIQYINENYNERITINDLSEQLYISRNYLSQIFKKATGLSFNQYINKVRMEKAKCLISEGQYLIYEIAEKVGFKNTPYFSSLFKKYTGMNPTDLLKC